MSRPQPRFVPVRRRINAPMRLSFNRAGLTIVTLHPDVEAMEDLASVLSTASVEAVPVTRQVFSYTKQPSSKTHPAKGSATFLLEDLPPWQPIVWRDLDGPADGPALCYMRAGLTVDQAFRELIRVLNQVIPATWKLNATALTRRPPKPGQGLGEIADDERGC